MPPAQRVRRRDGAVGQVETPAARRASVFVGGGERAAQEPALRRSRRGEALSQTPRTR